MNNSEDIKIITDSLNKNPMFRLSLGSKELFHSNFLEFLWEQNKTAFLKMLGEMISNNENETRLKEIIKKVGEDNLKLAREKEHFDICIYHNDGNKIVYDIIIENKVKSIPYKPQLDEYVKKIEEKQGETAIFILLSLVKNFPQKDKIEDWNIVNYSQLETLIRTHYSFFCYCVMNQYIKDYCNLVENLCKIEECIEESESLSAEQYQLLKDIRLHDLYHKLTGSIFIGDLYKRLIEGKNNNELLNNDLITIGKEDREDKVHKIFLSSSYNNGKGTITAAILKNRVFYTIQIEGDQYRHMVNMEQIAKNNFDQDGKKIEDNKLEAELVDNKFALDFLKFKGKVDESEIQDKLNKHYCKYGSDVVYKYVKKDDSDDMLGTMAEDVINTCKQLNIN